MSKDLTEIKHFIIRVYGLILNEKQEILISDEYNFDRYMTKFPGGGLKFGEGPEDCIKREAREEFDQDVIIISHFYTTGFFQKARFYNKHQLLSIYYKLKFIEKPGFNISENKFDFNEKKNGNQSFRWVKIKDLKEKDFSFPIDRFVLKLLKKEYK